MLSVFKKEFSARPLQVNVEWLILGKFTAKFNHPMSNHLTDFAELKIFYDC